MPPSPPDVRRLLVANDEFQVLGALLTNRTKRHRRGEVVVQGVRPITLAVEAGWPLRAWITVDGARLSAWARRLIDEVPVERHYVVAAELMAQLAGRETGAELLAVAALPRRALGDLAVSDASVVCVCDRVQRPGNLGSIIRSCDAFGATAVVVTERSADPYDPEAVRASTGSVFTIPVVQVGAVRDVAEWVRDLGVPMRLVGTDEGGVALTEELVAPPVAIVVGNETVGLSDATKAVCESVVAIPMVGAASSLNAAVAASIVVHEATRGRRGGGGAPSG